MDVDGAAGAVFAHAEVLLDTKIAPLTVTVRQIQSSLERSSVRTRRSGVT